LYASRVSREEVGKILGVNALNAESKKACAKLCAGNSFANYNRIALVELDDDWAVTELKVQKDSLNPMGIVHGGAFYTMADCAAGMAAATDGRNYVTLSGNLSFLHSAKEGALLQASARVRRRGRTVCFVDVEIKDQNQILLASGNYIFHCTVH